MVFVHYKKRQQRHEARLTLFTFDQSHNLSLTAVSNLFIYFLFFYFLFLPSGQKNEHTVNITLTYAVIVVDFVSFLAHSCQLNKQLSKSRAALVLI